MILDITQPEQIREMRLTIFHNAVRGMRVLFDATRKLGIRLENPDKNAVYGSQLLLLDNVAQVSFKLINIKS